MSDDRRLSTDIGELLSDAVADVEPAHRLDAIRGRTTTTTPARRSRWLVVGSAAVATAAAVTAVTVLTDRFGLSDDAPPVGSDAGRTTALYFVGDTPLGPRLYREFELVPYVSDDGIGELEAIASTPGAADPDYRTPWPDGAFTGVSDPRAGEVTVSLGPGLTERLPGMSEVEARLALQQVVYTLDAAFQENLAVTFVSEGRRSNQVLGVPTLEPVERAPELDVLSLVSISDPAEGEDVSKTFVAKGRASSFEATVPWQIRAGGADGDVVQEGFATAEGWVDGLYPWETEIDVSSLESGDYTFVAMTADPSGGAEGPGPFSDTRTIVVE